MAREPFQYLGMPVRQFEEEISFLSRDEQALLSGALFNLIESCLVLSGLAGSMAIGSNPIQARHDAVGMHDLVWDRIVVLCTEVREDEAKLN